ncbi:MAG TPA: hypothetical protein VFS63_13480 [Pseudolabrys sp.]|jgi:hypothetical protein|nr:hypothetical protein [Pseudolabrys sp.]
MRYREFALSAALLIATAAPSSATVLISEDRGGQIGHYLETFAAVRSSGERVVIDGNCLSACTLVLGVIPRDRICVTPRARLGFHAAWMPDHDGRPVTSPMGTQALWKFYPNSVRRWINQHGGLSRHMIFLQGRDLAAILPSCNAPRTVHARANSRRHHLSTAQALRYQRASAARDSH